MTICSAALRPLRSAYRPSTIAPTGRMKKPTPKVAKVSSSEAVSSDAGKKSLEMIALTNPKTTKSYHSRAFPTTAATICRVRGTDLAIARSVGPASVSPRMPSSTSRVLPALSSIREGGFDFAVAKMCALRLNQIFRQLPGMAESAFAQLRRNHLATGRKAALCGRPQRSAIFGIAQETLAGVSSTNFLAVTTHTARRPLAASRIGRP